MISVEKLNRLEKSDNEYLIDWHELNYNDRKIVIKIEDKLTAMNIEVVKIDFIENYIYYSKYNEKIIINEIIKHYGSLPKWVIKKEDYIRMVKIREIIK